MNEVEGVGAFLLGVGKHAMFPCGKSEIANIISMPLSSDDIKAFDTNDQSVFSNN